MRIQLTVSETEYRHLEERADACGLRLPTYMRKCLGLNERVSPSPGFDRLGELDRRIARLERQISTTTPPSE